VKRDMDLIRKLLMIIEEEDLGEGLQGKQIEGRYTELQAEGRIIQGHLHLMAESQLIDVIDASASGGLCLIPERLTALGHDYLSAIRDENVWSKTKEAVGKAGGSAVLEAWKATATEISGYMINAAIKSMIS
jgi:hypothetical protein